MKDDLYLIEEQILLLQLIKNNGNIDQLIINPGSHNLIFKMINDFRNRGFIKYGPSITLSNKGEQYLLSLNKQLNRKGLYKYISRQLYYTIQPINSDDIYVPLKFFKD